MVSVAEAADAPAAACEAAALLLQGYAVSLAAPRGALDALAPLADDMPPVLFQASEGSTVRGFRHPRSRFFFGPFQFHSWPKSLWKACLIQLIS